MAAVGERLRQIREEHDLSLGQLPPTEVGGLQLT